MRINNWQSEQLTKAVDERPSIFQCSICQKGLYCVCFLIPCPEKGDNFIIIFPQLHLRSWADKKPIICAKLRLRHRAKRGRCVCVCACVNWIASGWEKLFWHFAVKLPPSPTHTTHEGGIFVHALCEGLHKRRYLRPDFWPSRARRLIYRRVGHKMKSLFSASWWGCFSRVDFAWVPRGVARGAAVEVMRYLVIRLREYWVEKLLKLNTNVFHKYYHLFSSRFFVKTFSEKLEKSYLSNMGTRV